MTAKNEVSEFHGLNCNFANLHSSWQSYHIYSARMTTKEPNQSYEILL